MWLYLKYSYRWNLHFSLSICPLTIISAIFACLRLSLSISVTPFLSFFRWTNAEKFKLNNIRLKNFIREFLAKIFQNRRQVLKIYLFDIFKTSRNDALFADLQIINKYSSNGCYENDVISTVKRMCTSFRCTHFKNLQL